MVTFDICLVTYNSQKWIEPCVESLCRSEYDHSKLNIIFVDNNSKDDTAEILLKVKEKYKEQFSSFQVILEKENHGFGKGNNIAVKEGTSEWILLLNVDTEITTEAFFTLSHEITASERKIAAFEMRQIPFEAVKYYDPVTLKTSWCTGAGVAIRRDVYEEVGGFDETIFMYSEDVDLSWKIRAKGYELKYVPQATFYHYTMDVSNPGPKRSEQIGSFAGNLMLRYKYGNDETVLRRELICRRTVQHKRNRDYAKEISKRLDDVKIFKEQYRRFYHEEIEGNEFIDAERSLIELDEIKYGAFIPIDPAVIDDRISFSVVVRTYKRPELLRLTLMSLAHQTYKNFEVIVVEDGEQSNSAAVVSSFQTELDISYYCLGYHGGRGKACNVGVEKAKGVYICFLDDDDYFFADHLETMAFLISNHTEKEFFALNAMEGKVVYTNNADPTSFKYIRKNSWRNDDISREVFLTTNPLPIQSFAFRKELFDSVGKVDESLDAFEDWDLWIRMAIKTDIAYLNKTTSIFKTPFDSRDLEKREGYLSPYRPIMAERVNEYKKKIPEFDQSALERRNTTEESGFMTVGLYEENAEVPNLYEEIPHTMSWKITFPLRKVVAVISSAIGKPELSLRFGPLIESSNFATKSEREDIVNYALTSWCWRLAEKIQKLT